MRDEIIPWIADFLTSHRQRVQYQSATSAWETLSCGVPQGTKFGPITFIGIIDSAASDSKTHTFKYVDDLSLAEVRPTNQPSQIDKDVQDRDNWANSHYLKLNPSKCKFMQVCVMSFYERPSRSPSSKIAGKELEVVTETKLLGLTVQSNLSWDMQVDSTVGKSSRRLYMLNHLKRFGLPEDDLVFVFVSYELICSSSAVVEYATPVWHGCLTEEQSKKLESILKSVCRIILGAKYNSYTEALDLTGLQTLSNRRIQHCTKFAVDCTRSDRYSEWFPLNNKTHGMTLRWSRTYQTLRSRTLQYGKSPLPYLCDCKQRKGACMQ